MPERNKLDFSTYFLCTSKYLTSIHAIHWVNHKMCWGHCLSLYSFRAWWLLALVIWLGQLKSCRLHSQLHWLPLALYGQGKAFVEKKLAYSYIVPALCCLITPPFIFLQMVSHCLLYHTFCLRLESRCRPLPKPLLLLVTVRMVIFIEKVILNSGYFFYLCVLLPSST